MFDPVFESTHGGITLFSWDGFSYNSALLSFWVFLKLTDGGITLFPLDGFSYHDLKRKMGWSALISDNKCSRQVF